MPGRVCGDGFFAVIQGLSRVVGNRGILAPRQKTAIMRGIFFRY